MQRLIDSIPYENHIKWQMRKTSNPELRADLMNEFDDKCALFEYLFRKLPQLVQPPASVLCLGARTGEEVQAFRNLGYEQAIGLDLVPCLPLVLEGDFNALQYEDESIDIVYTNAIDHCWQIENFIKEILRVLKPGGLAVLHICVGHSREYESYHFHTGQEVADLFENVEMLVNRDRFGITLTVGGLNYELILRKNELIERPIEQVDEANQH